MLNTKHLNEQEVAQCADAINGNAFNSLPMEIREHLAICDECASEVLTVADMAFGFSADTKKGKIFQISTIKRIAIISSAAAIVLFVALFTTTQFSFFNSPEKQIASYDSLFTDKVDSVSINVGDNESQLVQVEQGTEAKIESPAPDTSPSNKLLASYEPNSELEKLYDNFASAYRSDDISVVSDRIVRVPANDSLKWSNPSKEIMNVDIFNNKGNRILTLSSNTNGIKIPALDDGLYYWKLINQDFDLLFVGKIFVENQQ